MLTPCSSHLRLPAVAAAITSTIPVPMKPHSLRHHIATQLDVDLHPRPGLSWCNRVIIAAILVSTAMVILETEPALFEPHRIWFVGFEKLILALFGIEFLLRLWTCIENPAWRSRLAYVRSPATLLDLVVIVSIGFTLLGLEGVLLRLLRLIRLLRVARLGHFSRALGNIGHAIAERRMELVISVMIAFSLLLLSASALYVIESEHQPEAFGSIPRAMWWSVATLTTVGYGDIVPVTPLGKIFAALTAITGIGLIAMPAGILASAFSAAMRRADAEEEALEP